MSKEKENENENDKKDINENIPGSSKDANIKVNDNNNDQQKHHNELENKQLVKFVSKRDETENGYSNSVQLHDKKSLIRNMEAFVYMRVPPDSGFAWIVLLVSFLSIVSIDGIRLSIGRIMPAISTDMGLNYKQSALIASLQIGFYYFCGPFACALIHKLSYRAVSMFGACLSILGIMIGSFSTDFITLLISFGIIAGIGSGMVAIATQIIVGFYFEKYRPIAVGLCSAGSGFGVLIFSPLYNFITINYGWRNVLRCQAIVCIAVFILGILYRPVKPIRIGQIDKKIDEDIITYSSEESFEISSTYFPYLASTKSSPSISNKSLYKKSNTNISQPQSIPKLAKPSKNDYVNFLFQCCKSKQSTNRSQLSTTKSKVVNTNEHHIEVNPLDRQDIFYIGKPDYQQPKKKLDGEIILLSGSVQKVQSIHYTISVTKPLLKEKLELDYKAKYVIFSRISSTIKLLIDPNLLQTTEFQYLLASSFLFTLGAHVPYLYLTAHVEIPKFYANYLLSAIGIANIILRIAGGFLAYSIKTNPVYLAGIPMAISGIFTIITGFIGKEIIWYQFIYCIILGSGFAFYASLKSIIFVQLLGLEKLTNAVGLTSLAMGLASFLGTNLAGWIQSMTGKANYSFLFSGITLFLGGFVYIILPTVIKINFNSKSNNEK